MRRTAPPGPRCSSCRSPRCGGGGGGRRQGGRRRQRPDQDLVLEQRRGGGLGQGDGREVERGAPEREGHRPGDPGGQDLRGGHRRLDHGRQRAVPDLQHLARRGPAVPEAGRARRARQPAGRQRVRREPQRRPRRAVPVRGRQVLPAAVEGQPGDDLLQPEALQEGRDRRREPAAGHLRRVPRDVAQARHEQGARTPRSGRPRERVLPVVVRLLPAVHRRERGKPLVEDGKAQFAAEAGQQVAAFWQTMYEREASRRTRSSTATRSASRRPRWRSSARGRSRSTATRSTGASRRCRPPPASPPSEIQTFSDEKSIGMYSACKNRGTAWDVLKFATSKEQDGALLEATGQMPMRPDLLATFPDYFEKNPEYKHVRRAGRPHRRGAERGQLDRRSGRRSATPTRSR